MQAMLLACYGLLDLKTDKLLSQVLKSFSLSQAQAASEFRNQQLLSSTPVTCSLSESLERVWNACKSLHMSFEALQLCGLLIIRLRADCLKLLSTLRSPSSALELDRCL